MEKKALTYTLEIEHHDPGYLAYFPALLGCDTWGRTYEAAVKHAEEALIGFLEALQINGEDIPVERPSAPLGFLRAQRCGGPTVDEATSALDYESERIIHTNMRSIATGRTVIIIAHRLAAVRSCDFIIAIRDGRLVEQGAHRELVMRADGVYAKLWRLQNENIRCGCP